MLRSLILASSLAVGLGMSGLGLSGTRALAAGGGETPPGVDWSFAGPFGTFDRGQLQRGLKVFREVCSACHGMSLVRFRNFSQPGGPEFTTDQVATLAAEFQIKDGPNDQGEMFERPGRPADAWPSPFPNEQAARAANGGAYPPDFSVLSKARGYERGFPLFLLDIFTQYNEAGPNYIAALLKGYVDPPEGFVLQPGQYYNKYMAGHIISMPSVLSDGQVEYPKDANGKPVAPETLVQYAKDVTAFLTWAAEPHLEQRKRVGIQVMLFLLVFAGLLYFTKKRVWAALPEHAPGAH